ncbi:MAG: TldD/PmbA family protein [Asgard group archaeon]|nr:TldD/PmbA family protein [Asgard group archaeon]
MTQNYLVKNLFDILRYGLDVGEKLGADNVEARIDDLQLRTLIKENKKIKETNINRRSGLGITTYYKGVSGYSYTANLEKKAVKECVKNAFGIAKASSSIAKLKLVVDKREKTSKVHDLKLSMKKHPKDFDLGYKIDLMDRIETAALADADWIKSSQARYGEFYGSKYFMNTDGDEISWQPIVIDLRIRLTAPASNGASLVSSRNKLDGSKGLELFDKKGSTPEVLGEQCHEWLKEQREAKAAPAGKFRALCDNGLSGVLAHESFGHCTEADAVLTNSTVLKGQLGVKIGTEIVNIIDEGTPDQQYNAFWLPFDDEGTPTTRTVLVENGILKGYLHNRASANFLKGDLTGNARAIHYRYNPIPRMKNTYFEPGDLTEEEAIEQLKEGIYAIQTSGGQVNPTVGTFLFKAVRGYWIENGKIKYPIKDVTIKGELLALLNNVEGLTKELKIDSGYFGGCGKGVQYPLPTGKGSPKILFSEAMFGGEQ